MKVIYKIPSDPIGQVIDIPNTLEDLQNLVGGNIETVTFCTDMTIICNEDGRMQGMKPNCNVVGFDFVGPIVAVGVKGEDFTDVPITLEKWRHWIS